MLGATKIFSYVNNPFCKPYDRNTGNPSAFVQRSAHSLTAPTSGAAVSGRDFKVCEDVAPESERGCVEDQPQRVGREKGLRIEWRVFSWRCCDWALPQSTVALRSRQMRYTFNHTLYGAI